MATITTNLLWKLDIAGSSNVENLLKVDRQIRSGIGQTDRAYRKLAESSTSVSAKMTRSSGLVAEGVSREGRAAQSAAAYFDALSKRQADALAVSSRLVAGNDRVTASVKRQARAVEEASVKQRAAARLQKVGAGTVGVGAAVGRGVRGTAAASGLGIGGGLAVGFGFAAAARQTVEFDRSLRNVNSIAQLSEKQLQAVGKALRDLGGKTAQAPKTLADGMYDLVSSNFSAKDSLLILKSSAKAATAGLSDTATSTKAVAAVLNAYHRPAKDAADVSDVLFQTVNRGVISFGDLAQNIGTILPFAASLDVNLNQVGAAASTLTKQGISAETTFVDLRQAMSSMIKPSKGLQAALDKLGVSNAETLIKSKGFQGALEALIGTTDGTKASVSKLFPNVRALTGVLALVGKNTRSAHEDLAAFKDVTGATDKALSQQSKSVSYQFNQLKSRVSGLAIGLGNTLVPAANSALKALSQLGDKSSPAGGVLAGLSAGLKNLPAQSTVGPRGIGPHDPDSRLAAQTPDQSVSIAQRVGAVARTIGTSAITAGKQLLDAFKPAMPFLQNVLLPLLEGIGKGLLISIVGAFKIAIPIIKVAATALGFIGKVMAPLKGVFQGLGIVIGVVFTGPILKLLSGLGKLGKIAEIVGGAFSKLGNVASKGLERIAPKTVEAFKNLPGHLKDMGIAAGGALVDGLRSIAGTLGKAAAKLGGGIVDAIRNLNFFNLGKRIVNAIVSGIKSLPGAVWNAIKGIAGGAKGIVGGLIGKVTGKRRGGRIGRYADGGLVPAYVSPGEMLAFGGQSMVVPGPRVAADNTLAMVPPGTAVFTASGQGLLASGASPSMALAMQAPHFANGGLVYSSAQIAATAARAHFPRGDLRIATAIALAESGGRVNATNRNSNGTIDRGLWQINSIHGAQSTYDPNANARAAYAISDHGRNWHPWVTYNTGAYRKFLNRTSGSLGKIGAPDTSGKDVNVPIVLGASRTRGGLLDDALAQGISAGQAGLTVSQILAGNRGVRGAAPSPILAAIAGAQTPTTRQINIPGAKASAATGKLPSGVYKPSTTWNPRGLPIARWIAPYLSYGSSHGWKGIVTSGYRSKAQQAAIYNSGVRPAARPGTSNHEGYRYPRGAVDVTAAATLSAALQKKPGPHLLVWAGAKDPVHFSHPHGGSYRRGGIIGRFRTGGIAGAGPTLNRSLSKALTFAGGSLAKLDEAITTAAEERIEALRAAIVKLVRKGGDKKTIQRLQGVLSAIDFEIGRRIGREGDVITQRAANLDRAQGALDRTLRKLNVSADSVVGLAIQSRADAAAIAVRQQNVASAKRALDLAKRTGDKSAIKDATDQLHQAQDDLDEAVTKHIEDARNAILAVAQQGVDTAGFHTDVANNALAGLDIVQRLQQSADTPAGMLQKAQAIQSTLVPSLQESLGALQTQFQTLAASGDVAGSRQAFLAVQQAGNDIASAMADSADLIRQAAEQGAQDVVDAATHRTSLDTFAQARLELEQRLGGTFDSAGGAQARADFINQTIIPDLQREVATLIAQQATAQQVGDQKLADQIAEAIASKQNDLLQASLDAQQQTAENTSPLKDFQGPTGFQAFNQGFTDLIGAGVGA